MELNLNADLGESFGAWSMGDDERMLAVVNSANVACGFHAGDPLVLSETLRKAALVNVSIGAHPGFPDLQGFGRRQMAMADNELAAAIQYQLAACEGLARCQGTRMTHVKPHGALNNMACDDRDLANCVVKAVYDFDPDLIFLAPALSELAAASIEVTLPTAIEVFADRAYTEQGSLVPRSQPGAVLESADACIAHVKAMIEASGIVTQQGSVLPVTFHSICVHGDNAHSVDTASQLSQALLAAGHELFDLPTLLGQSS